jgi:hypothetical protein
MYNAEVTEAQLGVPCMQADQFALQLVICFCFCMGLLSWEPTPAHAIAPHAMHGLCNVLHAIHSIETLPFALAFLLL